MKTPKVFRLGLLYAGFLILAFGIWQPVLAVSDVQLKVDLPQVKINLPLSVFNPLINKLHSLQASVTATVVSLPAVLSAQLRQAGASVSSALSGPQPTISDILSAWSVYVGKTTEQAITAPPITTVAKDRGALSEELLLSSLRSLLRREDIRLTLRGEQGTPGATGPQGPAGPTSAFTPLAPPSFAPAPTSSNTLLGASAGYAALGAQELNTKDINISNNLTQSAGRSDLKALTSTSLSVNGAATLAGNVSISGTNTLSVGTGATTLGGDLTASGAVTIGGALTVSGTTTLNGLVITNSLLTSNAQSTFTKVPTLAHVFSPSWPSGTSNASDGTIYINPASSIADGNLISAAVGGTIKFLVDAEGDVYAGNLILSGSTSSGATTIAGNLTVQDSVTFGDATSDTVSYVARVNSNVTFTTDNTNDVGASGANRPRTIYAGTSVISPLFTGALTGNVTGNVSGSSGSTTGNAATVTTNANLTGGVTSVGNAATVITNANLTGGVTSVGNAATVITNANLTGAITSVGNATSIAAQTGTGTTFVMNTSPTLVTPVLGAATATTINGLTITANGTNTLNIAAGKTLTLSNSLTFTGTDASSIAFGTGGTVAYTANALSAFGATTSAQLAGVISDETGTGLLVYGTAPTLASTVTIGTAGGTTGAINLKGTTSGTATITTAAAAGTYTLTLPTSAGTSGQVLTTDGTGVLSWITPYTGITQDFKGLSLRTSPNADVAATTVVLDHADEIVMDTGNKVATWDDLSAVITTSGAGGLDTGSEAASTWYEIYAIRKSSDGTKNLLLHRAKDYLLDQQQTTRDNAVSLRETSSLQKLAQTFATSITGPSEMADVQLVKVGSPTGRVWLSIYATSAGAPTGAALKTSDKLDASLIATGVQWVRFIFRDPQTLTAGTTYALVFEGDFTVSGANYLQAGTNTAGGYASGSRFTYDGATWTNSAGQDHTFKVYVTENNTSVTMPSGYDQKAHVGYVYNDSGSNFRAFSAQNHTVFQTQYEWVAGSSVTIPTLFDVSAVVPPGPVVVWNDLISANAGPTVAMIQGVPCGYGDTSACPGRYGNVDASGGWNTAPWPTITEFQGEYAWRQTGTSTFTIESRKYEWGSSGGADLAEEYLVHDESISAGDVVSLTSEKLYVEKASIEGKSILGIVSTKPGITLKDWPNDISPENVRAIALSGRVPVKISNENGEIKVGDRLTLSKTIPGYAMKQTEPGQSIGIAMEESTENIDKILTFVNLSYWAPGLGNFSLNEDGTSTNNSFFDGLLSFFKNAFEIVFEKGLVKVANLVASLIKTQDIEVKGAGVTVYDRTSGEPYCLGVDNGTTVSTPGVCAVSTPTTPTPPPTSEPTPENLPSETSPANNPPAEETPPAEEVAPTEETSAPEVTPEPGSETSSPPESADESATGSSTTGESVPTE